MKFTVVSLLLLALRVSAQPRCNDASAGYEDGAMPLFATNCCKQHSQQKMSRTGDSHYAVYEAFCPQGRYVLVTNSYLEANPSCDDWYQGASLLYEDNQGNPMDVPGGVQMKARLQSKCKYDAPANIDVLCCYDNADIAE